MGNEEVLHYIFKRISTAWVVLGITLTATIWGSLLINHIEQQQTQKNVFDYRVERIKLIIKNRFKTYQQILQSGAGLFAASEQVGHKEWKRFVDHLGIREYYSDIQGVGFTKLIPFKEKNQHIQEVRNYDNLFSNYNIRPEGVREYYTSIVYLEPLDERNQVAIGYDMFSEPVRRVAMERARDTNNIALSGKVTLVQEIDEDKQAGFLLYLPVYKQDVPLETVDERRTALLGYVYSPFRMNDFMQGIFGEKPSGIDIHIYDGDLEGTPHNSQLLYDEMSDNTYDSQFNTKEKLTFAGHTWTIYFYSLPEFEISNKTYTSKVVLVGGLAVSFLLFGFTRSFETARLLEAEHKLTLKLKREIAERKQIENALRKSEERFDLAMRGSNDGLWDWNIETDKVYFSPRWKEMLGYDADEIQNNLSEWSERVHPDDLEQAIINVKKHFNKEISIYQNTHRIKHKNGHYIWILDRGIAIWNEEGKPIRMVGTHTDLTLLKQVELELTNAKQLSDEVINSLPGIFYMLDNNGCFTRCNSNLHEIIGYTSEEIIGKSALTVIANKDKDLISKKIQNVFETGAAFVEAGLLDKSGNTIPYYFTGKRIYLQDKLYLIGLGLDISARKKLEEELWQLANTDFLTGLKNRRYFMEKIEEEFQLLCNHGMCCCSILMLDLDHFKRINDTYGHAVGDTVLKHFSVLLQNNLRQVDITGRLGGEEFAVILPYVNINEAKQCAERLRNIVANSPIVEDNNIISITVSIGISMLRENDRYADTALIRADDALFLAKKSGRNTIQIAV